MNIKKFDSINVVPFIDIMLVLLVIVLTTATFVAKGYIPVDLSKAKSATKIEKVDELVITIDKNMHIYFNKEKVLKGDVEIKLKNYKKDTRISISCDKSVAFSEFVFLLDAIKLGEFKNLGIVTQYE
ncbi:MAG: biopolymer transporter ExbD [Campylobacterota bacterium]|nr:biopolymer transporter ExbD [Campylobacterota bacterium]